MANEFKIKKGLIVDGTGTVVDIQGTQGQLFSVTDNLAGSNIFAVSDISGVPILQCGVDYGYGNVSIDMPYNNGYTLNVGSTGNGSIITTGRIFCGDDFYVQGEAIIPSGPVIVGLTSNFNSLATAKVIVKGNQTFGLPGLGINNNGRWLSIEGNADASGEGSGRIFFTEHNSTTAGMDNYGMSLGYRGGATSIVGASGNTWTGLTQIGNGQWGMFGHNDDATGALIMSGDRAATFVEFHSNDIKGAGDIYVADQIIHTGDTNTYMQFHAADQWRVVTGGTERLEVNNSLSTFTTPTLIQTTGGGMLTLKDTNSTGDAATPYINFVDSAGTRQGYVGIGSGGSAKLYLEGLDGIQTNNPLAVNGNLSTSGDLTVSGGDISLGGTGRIQGVDTVSASTDAANKAYVDNRLATLGQSFTRSGINSSTYTMLCTVAGDRLASVIEMTITGTSGSVVIASSFEIICNHSTDIHVRSMSGDYSKVTLRITSNNNEDYSIEAKHNGSSTTEVEVFVFPRAGETITPTTTDPGYTGAEYEHHATDGWRFGGEDGNVESSTVIIDGKLGVGTSSPGVRLQVGDGDIQLDDGYEILWDNNGLITAGETINLTTSSSTSKITLDGNDSAMIFTTGNSVAVTIDDNQEVGIGTTTPNQKLHVNGATQLGDISATVNFGTVALKVVEGTVSTGPTLGSGAVGAQAVLYSNGQFGMYTGVNGTTGDTWMQSQRNNANVATYNILLNPAGGRVAIGHNNPTGKLDVFRPDTNYSVNLSDTLSRSGLVVKSSGNFDSKITFSSGAGSRQYIQALNNAASTGRDISINPYGGNVGVGTSAPGQKLTVNGRALIQNSTTPFYIKVNSTYKSWVHHIASNDTYVLAPSTADGGETWDWTNQTSFSTSGIVTANNFVLSSDKRNKTKIEDLTGNNVDISWKSFEMKGNEGEYRTGVIAQELEENHPEFVNTDDKGFKSVKYIDLLIAKIAELEARLEKLEK